jgi:pre-rRNA-processing protein TSR4
MANPFASWGGASANPFSCGAVKVVAAANPFAPAPKETKPDDSAKDKDVADLPKTFAETLNLNNPKAQAQQTPPPAPEAWPEESALPKPYPALFLVDVDYETLEPTTLAIPANARMEIDDTADGASGGGSSIMAKDDFESVMDATFQKFADRMAQNPEQVIRYEFAGQPLLYSKVDGVAKALGSKGMPRCAACGAGRVFELQLTPGAITELEADEMSLEGMEWGTVMVGVCEKDCQAYGVDDEEVGYLEEWAGVQWEELVK